MASINLKAGEVVLGGTVVDVAAQTVTLVDNSGGPLNGQGGDGRFVVALNAAGAYIVTKDADVNETATLIRICEAFVVNGVPFISDRRNRQVSHDAVNATIGHAANSDGSYLASGVVTGRTLGQDVLAQLGATVTTTGFTAPAIGNNCSFGVKNYLIFAVGEDIQVVQGGVPFVGQIFSINPTTSVLTVTCLQPGSVSIVPAGSLVVPGATTAAFTVGSATDVDQTTQGSGKVLSETASGGKPFSWQTPSGGSVGTFDALVLSSFPNYYKFNEASGTTVTDYGAGAANGTYHGTVIFQSNQVMNDLTQCAQFESTNAAYATFTNPTTSATAFTFMFAGKLYGSAANQYLFSDYDGTNTDVGLVFDTGNLLKAFLHNVGYASLMGYPGSGVACIYFVQYDGTKFTAWYNGALVASVTAAYTKRASTISVGALGTSPGQYLSGIVGRFGMNGSAAIGASSIVSFSQRFLMERL